MENNISSPRIGENDEEILSVDDLNERAEEGVRFDIISTGTGEAYRKFVNGSMQGTYTAAQLQPFLQRDSEDGVETIEIKRPGGGGKSLSGFRLAFTDDDLADIFLPNSLVLEDYDPDDHTDWSINIPVTDGNVDITITTDDDDNLVSDDITYDDGTLLYGRIDGSGNETDDIDADNPQTFCRIPVIREGTRVSFGGFYREGIRCENGEPIVEFYQI